MIIDFVINNKDGVFLISLLYYILLFLVINFWSFLNMDRGIFLILLDYRKQGYLV